MDISAKQAGKKYRPKNEFFWGWLSATVFLNIMYQNWWIFLSQLSIGLIVLLIDYKLWQKKEEGTHINADDLKLARKILEYTKDHNSMNIRDVMEYVGLDINNEKDMLRVLRIVKGINKDIATLKNEQ